MNQRPRKMRFPALMLLLLLTLAGCAAETADEQAVLEPAAEEPAAEPAATTEPDAYFVNVEDGGTYTSPLEILFGVDGYQIVAVEDPMVVREGEGHFHLAVDVECAEPGTMIVQGDPSYIHFGDGSDSITMQFEPGEHSLCLQVADGEHRVLAGDLGEALTEQINITIEESGS